MTQRRVSRGRVAATTPILATFLVALSVLAAASQMNSLRLLTYRGSAISTDCMVGFIGYRSYHGHPIYTRASQPPYTPAIYTPLTYLSLATLGHALHPRSFQEFLVEGRILIFSAFLLIAVVAYFWARRWSAGSPTALASPLLVLADPTLFRFSAGQRPDVPALLFSLLGFSVLTLPGRERPAAGRVAAAGFLMGIAFLFKQTFVAAPAAAGIWLLWEKRFRQAALLTLAWAAPVAVTLVWFLLHDQPIVYGILLMRHNVYDIPGELRLLAYLAVGSPVIILQVALGLVGLMELRRRAPHIAPLAGIYLALAFALDLTTMASAGAVRWYLAEATTICSLLAPLGLGAWLRRLRSAPLLESQLAAALVLIGLPALSLAGPILGLEKPLGPWDTLSAAISGRRVFSDNAYIAAQSKKPEAVDPYLLAIFQKAAGWLPAPIVAQMEKEDFDYVVLETISGPAGRRILRKPFRGIPRYSPEILDQVERSYRLVGLCAGVNTAVFVPRQEPRGSRLANRLGKACRWKPEAGVLIGGSATGRPAP